MKRTCVVIILAIVQFCILAFLAADPPSLRVGVAKVDITPQEPVRMSGYESRKGLSTGVHDRLFARALAFEASGSRLVLVSSDLVGFYGDTLEPIRGAIIKRTGLQPSELFLSAIHTHAGPVLTVNRERGHPNNLSYTEGLKEKFAGLVASALQNLQPATVLIGVGSSPVGANRRELQINAKSESAIILGRNPYGPTDKEVLVLRVLKADGKPLAVAFGYATHATSLGPDNYTISGDVLGLAEQLIEKVTDSGGFAAAFAGASGNIDPWYRILPGFNTEPGWTPEPVLLGNLLGQEVVHVYRGETAAQSADQIRSVSKVLELPARPPSSQGSNESPTGRIPLVVTAARLGDVGFIGLGGEVFTEIGLAIKAGSPFRHTFVITLCNGVSEYLVPRHLYVEGGYEVDSSPFSPEAADIVVRESLSLLHGLRHADRPNVSADKRD